jgi:hypothetical protein
MIKQFMQQVINQAKSNLEEEASGRTKPLSAEPLPFDPSLGQPQPDKKEDDSRAAPVETASLMHREDRAMLQEGGPIDDQMGELMPEIPEEMAEEAPIPLEMEEEAAETQLPDEEMESNYIDFIVDEALDEEEEQYLLDKLSGDDQLSMIFDKVVETASEFSGAGPIEGPGSAVSDSIPARLSDGEFVMTAKATDQIGSNTLQELMSVAEQEADGAQRQTAEAGGLAKAEGSTILGGVSEDERSIALKNKEAMRLLDPRLSLFAS